MTASVNYCKQALYDSVSIFAAYFPLGIIWGILWEQAGLPPLWGILFSFGVFAGTVQFLTLSFIIAGEPFWGMVMGVIPVAIRNGFYTVAASERFPKNKFLRAYLAYGMADATFAVLASQKRKIAQEPSYSVPLAASVHVYWVAGTAIGVYTGGYIPDGVASLDFSLPALIVALVVEQQKKIRRILPVVIPCVAAFLIGQLTSQGWLMPAMALCALSSACLPKEEQ